MLTAEVQPVRDHVERPVQGDLGGEGPVREMVAGVQRRPAQDVRPDDAALIVAPAVEEHAPEPVRRPRGRRVHRVVDQFRYRARASITADQEWARTTCGCSSSAATQSFEQVAGVEVVMRRVFEQFAPGLLDHEIVIRGGADVVRLADVADPGILLRVAAADVSGAIGRGVVRNDQLEVLVTLAEQGLKSIRPGSSRRCKPGGPHSAGE